MKNFLFILLLTTSTPVFGQVGPGPIPVGTLLEIPNTWAAIQTFTLNPILSACTGIPISAPSTPISCVAQLTSSYIATGVAVNNLGFNPPNPANNLSEYTSSASASRANISAAKSGANVDITALTGLSTPLAIAFGGNGSVSPGIVAGTGTSISGSWPNQVINFTGATGGQNPGGSNGSIQYNNSGIFGGFVVAGDCTLSQPNILCTKTNGVSFGSLATLISAGGVTTALTNAPNSTGGFLTNPAPNSAFATMATKTIKSNVTGGSAAPSDNTASAIFDAAFTTTQGSLVYRNGSTWVSLAPGTNGQVLVSSGAGQNPAWGNAAYLPLSGGNITGNLEIDKASPYVVLNKPSAGSWDAIFGQNNGLNRWAVVSGDSTTESGSNAGSNFQIVSFIDAGTTSAVPFSIIRSTNIANFLNTPTFPTANPGNNSTSGATTAFVTASNNAYIGWNNVGGSHANLTYSGQSSQPSWLVGTNDGANFLVWNPSNFAVAVSDHLRGSNTGGNDIYIGWNGSALTSQVGGTGFGNTWPINISGSAASASFASTAGTSNALNSPHTYRLFLGASGACPGGYANISVVPSGTPGEYINLCWTGASG